MRIDVLRDKCVGSGNCVRLAEIIFDQDDDEGKVVLLVGNEMPHSEAVVQAAMLCPVAAILIDGAAP